MIRNRFFLFTALLVIFAAYSVPAQTRYFTKTGHIGFFSHTPVEDIKADNNQVTSFLDVETGELVFSVLIRSFEFEKALMQEHFNENYLESEKYPKASFKGKIKNIKEVDLSKPGEYEVTVVGQLEIHGVKQELSVPGKITVDTDLIQAQSTFPLQPENFQIKIPKVVRDKIAKNIAVQVLMDYKLYK